MQQTQPSLTIAKPAVAAYPTPIAMSNASLSINSYSPAHQDAVGQGEFGTIYAWNNSTSIGLSWSDLSYLGAGNVRIDVDYVRADGTAAVNSQTFDSATAANGINMFWTDDDQGMGTGFVTRVRVWKFDASGANLVPIFDQGGSGSFSNLVTSIIPPEVGTAVTAKTGPAGGALGNVAIFNMGARYLVNTLYWGAGNYDLEVLYQRPGESTAYAHSTGRFTSAGGVISNTTADVNVVPLTFVPTMTQTVDRWGNAIAVTEARGYVAGNTPAAYTTNYRYNYLNEMIEQKNPETDVWGENGLPTRQRPTVRNFFDQMGRGIGTIDANGNAARATTRPDSSSPSFTPTAGPEPSVRRFRPAHAHDRPA